MIQISKQNSNSQTKGPCEIKLSFLIKRNLFLAHTPTIPKAVSFIQLLRPIHAEIIKLSIFALTQNILGHLADHYVRKYMWKFGYFQLKTLAKCMSTIRQRHTSFRCLRERQSLLRATFVLFRDLYKVFRVLWDPKGFEGWS